MGLRFEAKDWAEKTHGIPYDWKCGEKDYYKIFTKIRNFLTVSIFKSYEIIIVILLNVFFKVIQRVVPAI